MSNLADQAQNLRQMYINGEKNWSGGHMIPDLARLMNTESFHRASMDRHERQTDEVQNNNAITGWENAIKMHMRRAALIKRMAPTIGLELPPLKDVDALRLTYR